MSLQSCNQLHCCLKVVELNQFHTFLEHAEIRPSHVDKYSCLQLVLSDHHLQLIP